MTTRNPTLIRERSLSSVIDLRELVAPGAALLTFREIRADFCELSAPPWDLVDNTLGVGVVVDPRQIEGLLASDE